MRPNYKKQADLFMRATAYMVLNSVVAYDAYWPDDIKTWARDLMKGEKRTGGQLVQEGIRSAARSNS